MEIPAKNRFMKQSSHLSTVGLEMPDDFPSNSYEAIHTLVTARKDTYPDAWREYAGAWNAVAYRFLSCARHDEAFTDTVRRFGTSPPPPQGFTQEDELFGFFVTGLAAIESLCYGLYFVGAMTDGTNFPAVDLRGIEPAKTVAQFSGAFPNENITTALVQLKDDKDFKDWKEIRNILGHRVSPGRRFHRGGTQDRQTLWLKDIQIDEDRKSTRLNSSHSRASRMPSSA